MNLSGTVCVVTGASSGIGRQVALDLAALGAAVCVVARRQHLLRELLGSLSGEGHSLFTADISDPHQVSKLAAHVEEFHGRCDVLVNNAGFSAGGSFDGTAALEDLHRVMDTNFFGAIHCAAELLPLLKSSAPSHIVNVTSIAGRLPSPGASTYCASKFALAGWTESARFDLERKGIFLSTVEPGPIPTEGFPQKGLTGHPWLRRLVGTPGDVSAAVVDVIENKKAQRVVPRPYYLLQFLKLTSPRLYRFLARRIMNVRRSSGR